jgi:pyruvate carboxylase
VMTTLNGQLRPVYVRDRSIAVTATAAEKADPNRAGHVAAPFAGVVTLKVEQGAAVAPGETIATIEAMKMEASITTAVGGTVARIAVPRTAQVEAQDLLLVVE